MILLPEILYESLPSRERGLKLYSTQHLTEPLRRSLRGSVD